MNSEYETASQFRQDARRPLKRRDRLPGLDAVLLPEFGGQNDLAFR